ncbi:MAG TPA: hypothetical protein VNR42_01045 [Solirubrobacteraceae bacterium]|nr:hypothetical protein [Solirubrobacteraceae bacterium]
MTSDPEEGEYVVCIGCGKARPNEGPACPLCGSTLREDVDPHDVAEKDWVL